MRDFIISLLPQDIQQHFQSVDPSQLDAYFITFVVFSLIFLVLYIVIFIVLLKLNKKIFTGLERKKGRNVSYQFLEKVIMLILIVFFVVIPLGGEKISQSLLGSTAVIAAVVGLAANDVIKDMFGGLQISIYKPFNVGSRVLFEDGSIGVIEKLTLRHVVVRKMDTTRIIIPYS